MLGSPRRSSGRAGTGAADRDEPGPVTRSAAILRPLPRARHGPSVAPAATGAVQSRRVPGYVTATTPVETTGRSIRRRPRINVERSNAARSDGRHPSRQRYAHVSSLQQHAQRSATDPAESAEHYGGAREPPVCEDVRHLHSAGGSPHPQAPTSHQRPDPVHLVVRRHVPPQALIIGPRCPVTRRRRGIVTCDGHVGGRIRARHRSQSRPARPAYALDALTALVVHGAQRRSSGSVTVSARGVSGEAPRIAAIRPATPAGSLYRSKACTRT